MIVSANGLEAAAKAAIATADWAEAAVLFGRLVALEPNQSRHWMNLALARTRADGPLDPGTIGAYRRVLLLMPGHGRAWAGLAPSVGDRAWPRAVVAGDGRTLTLKTAAAVAQTEGRADLAACWLDRYLTVEPGDLQARTNRAMTRVELGRIDDALDDLDRVLDTNPGDARARYTRGWIRLTRRDWAGWDDYLARWAESDAETPEHVMDAPLWDGQTMAGGSLRLWGQFGVGDELLFAGLVAEAAERAGVSTRLDCDPRLVPLFRRSFPNVEVLSKEDTDTVGCPVAAQASTACLPAFLRRNLEAFPDRRSYLVADAERVAMWRARLADLGPPPYTGFAWRSGNARTAGRKSIPLDALSPLIQATGGTAISLQYSPDQQEEAAARARGALVPLANPAADIRDAIDDLAAQITALDRVVTISGINAHLAGALGVPGIVLMQRDPLWFWFADGTDSPWYPSLTVLRQDDEGGWDQALSTAVRHLAQGGDPR